MIQAIADRYEIDLDTPWRELTEEQQSRFLYGTNGDRIYVTTTTGWAAGARTRWRSRGSFASLERRYRETDSPQQRERIEEYMSFRPARTARARA